MPGLAVYAGRQLGAYGYQEKPWYQPGERLAAFLAELDARGLTEQLEFREAPRATDDDLGLFHRRSYIADVRRRCAANRGSLDRAPAAVNERSRRLLQAIQSAEVGSGQATAEGLAPVLTALNASLEAFARFLESEQLVVYDTLADAVRLTDQGRAFLDTPTATLGGPTYARKHVEEAARWICGASLDATRRILSGELTTAFVPIAGFHHAHPDQARLYCIYNDPGVAIAAAQRLIDGPIAYIDVDIHHGDGVYAAFADDPRVIIADLHEDPRAVPRSVRRTAQVGRDVGAGTKLTLALGPGTEDHGYLEAWEQAEAFVRAARPAFVVFEAGVDGLAGDPMSNQELTVEVFGEIARRVQALAQECSEGRLLVLGGGGYELAGMSSGWATVVEALLAKG